MATMVQHHTHYKEIDGYDEIVMMDKSEHSALHIRLRKEKKCNISTKELNKISINAHARTSHKNTKRFHSVQGKNVLLVQSIEYNPLKNKISIYSYFRSYNGYKLPRIDIE